MPRGRIPFLLIAAAWPLALISMPFEASAAPEPPAVEAPADLSGAY